MAPSTIETSVAMSSTRQSVQIPSPKAGVQLAGLRISPEPRPATTSPLVILAHGVTCTKDYGIQVYAEAFASAGYETVLFDYRGWGESQGTKHRVSFKEQQDDIRSVVRWARQQPDVDAKRIVLWGSSLGAGHCLAVAAKDPPSSYAAVICLNPYTSGYATLLRALTPWAMAYSVVALIDGAGSLLGTKPITCRFTQHCDPETGAKKKFSRGALITGKVPQGFWRVSGGAYFPHSNHAQARNLLQLLNSEVWLSASKVTVPILFTPIKGKDELCPPWTAARAAKRAPRGEYQGLGDRQSNHFSVYQPGLDTNCAEQAVAVHLDFLKRAVPV